MKSGVCPRLRISCSANGKSAAVAGPAGVAALTRLVGPDAELLVGTHLLGMTHRELADRYGLSVEVVKKRCQRANSKIRHELQDLMSQVDVPECI